MRHDRTCQPGFERQRHPAPALHHCYWVGLCLSLLVAACSTSPAPSFFTPVASGSAPLAPITAYHGHTSTVFAVAFSPDGKRVASGGNDSTVQVWNARTGHLLVKYTGHTGTVYALAWSPDGRYIASGGNDSTVQVWDDLDPLLRNPETFGVPQKRVKVTYYSGQTEASPDEALLFSKLNLARKTILTKVGDELLFDSFFSPIIVTTLGACSQHL